MPALARKFRISIYQVRKMLGLYVAPKKLAGAVDRSRKKFAKLHTRSRKFIGEFIKEATAPIQASDI